MSKFESDLRGYFGDIAKFLQETDPGFVQMLEQEKVFTDEESDEILRLLTKLKEFAHYMVRYAEDPRTAAVNPITGEALINPETGDPFTFEDLNIDRTSAAGSTTGVAGREKAIAQTMVALYRRLNS